MEGNYKWHGGGPMIIRIDRAGSPNVYGDLEYDLEIGMPDYYAERAKGGFGLIIQEITAVDPRGKATIRQAGIWDDKFIPGLRGITDAVHKNGGKIILQLHHCGRQTEPWMINGEKPLTVSKILCPMTDVMPEELTTDQIKTIVKQFGEAALRAKKAGCDGVDIHGANGYLIQQFMSPHSNKRMDEYGGSFSGRHDHRAGFRHCPRGGGGRY